jgi:hypothetical protein
MSIVISDKNASKRLMDLLKEFKIDVEKFNKALIDTGAVIAGSAVMQSVLGVKWDNSDIDIWLPVDHVNSVKNLGKAAHILQALPTYRMPHTITVGGTLNYERLTTFVSNIMTLKNKPTGAKTIQIMFVKTSIRDVISSFDFIESQMYYDGKNLLAIDNTIMPMLLKKQLHMSKIALEMQSPHEWIRTLKRVDKYVKRGFTNLDVTEREKIIKSISSQIDPDTLNEFIKAFARVWKSKPFCSKQIIITLNNNRVEMRIPTEADSLLPSPIIDQNDNTTPPQQCFDIIMYNDEDIEKYISSNSNDNIVIIEPSGKKAVCFSRDALQKLLKDPDTIFYPCIGRNGRYPVDYEKEMVRIYLSGFNVVVPLSDAEAAISNTSRIFRLYKADAEQYKTTSSRSSIASGANWIGRDHCQDGSDKQLYRLLPQPTAQGGMSVKTKLKYNGKMYKIHTGDRGGKYIMVDKKKIYATKLH